MFNKIGIVVADKDEFANFEKVLSGVMLEFSELLGKKAFSFACANSRVHCIHCGIGKVNAAAATMHLIDLGCEAVLNFGLSGGVGKSGRGMLVVPERFLEHDFDLTCIGYKPCEKPGQEYIYSADKALFDLFAKVSGSKVFGTAVCGDRFISSAEDSAFLSKTFNAVSCDMETAAIASVCHMAGVPYASLRIISDDAGDDAVESYNDMNTGSETLLFDAFYECLKAVCETEA